MKKKLLYLAALAALTIPYAAQANVFYQVPSEHWLADGGQYAVGFVMNHNTFKNSDGDIVPRFFNLNATNQAILTANGDIQNLPESMIWTLKQDDSYVCANTNADHLSGKVFHFGQLINGEMRYIVESSGGSNNIDNGINGNTLATKNSYDRYTATELVSIPTQAAFEGQQLFVVHVGWVNNMNAFSCRRGVNAAGNFNRFSSTDDPTAFTYSADNGYTAMTQAYLAITEANLATSAEIIWNAIAEDDIAINSHGYTEEHIDNLRNRELPDVSECTPETLISFLQEEYKKPIASEARFRAQDLDGFYVQIHHTYVGNANQTRTGAVSHVNGEVKVLPAIKATRSFWKAEYDEDADAVILSFGDAYLGALPTGQNIDVTMTNSRDEAGRYRFYTYTEDATLLLLTCTNYTDGGEVTNFVEGTAANPGDENFNVTNNWLTDTYSTDPNAEGSLTRFGSGAGSSHWQISILNSEEEVLDAALAESLGAPHANADLMAYAMDERINSHLSENADWVEKCNVYEQYATHIFAHTPAPNKFYRICSGLKFTSGIKGMTFEGNNMKWKSVTDDQQFIWSITPSTDGLTYILRNAVDGRYVKPISTDVAFTLQGEESSPITLTRITDDDCQFAILVNGGAMHAISHGNGNNASGNVSRYGTGGQISNASSWYFIEITDEEAEGLLNVYREHYNEEGLSGWPLTHMQNDLATINNPEASTYDKIAAYFEMQSLSGGINFEDKIFKIQSASETTKYAYVGNTANNNRIKVGALPTGDTSDYLFYYTDDHKLAHLRDGKYLDENIKLCEASSAGTVSFICSSVDNAFKIVFDYPYYAHTNGNVFDGCTTDPADHNNTHSFYIVPATNSDIDYLVKAMAEPTPADLGLTVGTEPGNVQQNESFTAWATWKSTAANMAHNLTTDNFTMESFDNAKRLIAATYLGNKYSVVPAENGRYYRIKASIRNLNYNNLNITEETRYLSNTNTGDKSAFVSTPNAGTIFFYNDEKHLISAENGRYIVNNNGTSDGAGFIKTYNGALPEKSALFNEGGTAKTDMRVQTITISSANAVEIGAYKLTFGNNNRSVHMSANANGGGEANCCSSQGNADFGHNFYLEQINELPVEIHGDGFGSIICPVALNVPAGDAVKLYMANINNEGKLTFEYCEGGVIAPNTHVIVKAAAGTTVNLALNYTATSYNYPGDEKIAAASHAKFVGSHIAHKTTVPAGTNDTDQVNIYVKTVAPAAEIMTLADDASDEQITFVKHEADTNGQVTIPAGTMAFCMESSADEIAPEVLTVSLNEGVGTTDITEVMVDVQPAGEGIYDLQGRRLTAPVKGINIINGRKVLVK